MIIILLLHFSRKTDEDMKKKKKKEKWNDWKSSYWLLLEKDAIILSFPVSEPLILPRLHFLELQIFGAKFDQKSKKEIAPRNECQLLPLSSLSY